MVMSSRCANESFAKFLFLTGATVILFLISGNELEAAQLTFQKGLDNGSHHEHEKHLLFTIPQRDLLKTEDFPLVLKSSDFRSSLWPLATVSYKIHPDLEENRSNIENALRFWEQRTCLLFTEIPYHASFSKPHLIFKSSNNFKQCKTFFGLVKGVKQPQPIYIGKKCNKSPEISKLIGYSIGVLPEPDNNIIYGRPNMYNQYIRKDQDDNDVILNFRSLKSVHTNYKCQPKHCTRIECKNGGLLSQNCQCMCPPGTVGKVCEKAPLRANKAKSCGGVVTKPSLIESPAYPNNNVHGLDCVWVITPEEGKGVELVVNDFDVDGTPSCLGDHVSISMQHQTSPNKRYCGRTLLSNDVLTHDADNNVIVKFRTSTQGAGRGFSFNVYFSEEYLELGTVSSAPEESL